MLVLKGIDKATILDLIDKGLAKPWKSAKNNINFEQWTNSTAPYQFNVDGVDCLVHHSAFVLRFAFSPFPNSLIRLVTKYEQCVEEARKYLFKQFVDKGSSYYQSIFTGTTNI